MRIDSPSCPLKSCRYCNDGNCTDVKDYEDCILREMIQIPQNVTNGDVIKLLFPQIEAKTTKGLVEVYYLDSSDRDVETDFYADWWNAPYKRKRG